ncbi:hypothetical protein [Sphaerisporangium dianthi]|uniref:Uncharacterized protein n=1 Tax=Sphaerisporangium dianthi TaxID=1436120 RepID=A0ABV9CCB7_9ACTN
MSQDAHAIAFRKDDTDFVRFANHVLESLRRNGRWAEPHREWLDGHPDKGPPPALYGSNLTWPPGP